MYSVKIVALFRGQYTLIQATSDDNKSIDSLTNHFTESERIKSRKKFSIPVIDILKDEKSSQKIWEFLISERLPVTDESIRDVIYQIGNEPTTFRLTWAKSLITTVYGGYISDANLLILDMSAGWGDRLITAISMNAKYIGFDPNIKLKDGHDRIIKLFGNSTDHRIRYEPFESANLEDFHHKVDIVFTSPPFFDLEVYSDDSTQSINRYPNSRDWVNNFLIKSLDKSWDTLKDGGYLILHISDLRDLPLCEIVYNHMKSVTRSKFEGIIGVSGTKGKASPVWIWKKR